MLVRRVWAVKGSRPRIKVTGSHRKTCVYGALGSDGRQLFRQYPNLRAESFLSFLKRVEAKFSRFILLMDQASWHTAGEIAMHLVDRENVELLFFPAYTPELNPLEECWRQPKNELMLRLYPGFEGLRRAIAEYYRTKRFRLNLINYLCR